MSNEITTITQDDLEKQHHELHQQHMSMTNMVNEHRLRLCVYFARVQQLTKDWPAQKISEYRNSHDLMKEFTTGVQKKMIMVGSYILKNCKSQDEIDAFIVGKTMNQVKKLVSQGTGSALVTAVTSGKPSTKQQLTEENKRLKERIAELEASTPATIVEEKIVYQPDPEQESVITEYDMMFDAISSALSTREKKGLINELGILGTDKDILELLQNRLF